MTSATFHLPGWPRLAALTTSIAAGAGSLAAALRRARTERFLASLDGDRQRDIGYEEGLAGGPPIEVDDRTMINLMSMR